MFEERERRYLAQARLGRLATVDADGRPHVVPVCFGLVDDLLVTPIDEKPQRVAPEDLRRVRNIDTNPRVALVVDHYSEDWDELGWVQILGRGRLEWPGDGRHRDGVTALEEKYDQYAEHDLASRPLIWIEPGSVRSWGRLDAGF